MRPRRQRKKEREQRRKPVEPSPAEPPDVHVTLEYRVDAELADWLPIGVLTIFCGLFLFAMEQPDLPPLGTTIGAAAAIVVGIGIAALSLWRRFRSRQAGLRAVADRRPLPLAGDEGDRHPVA